MWLSRRAWLTRGWRVVRKAVERRLRGDGASAGSPAAGRVVSGLFFFPRGGAAQVAREFARALTGAGWGARLAARSPGGPGELTNARSFFAGIDVEPLDYLPASEPADP